jgi:hypothetical protein
MKALENFCQNNRSKSQRSKLFPFRAEIFELAGREYSTYQIAKFLQEVKKQNVTHTTVFHFLRKNKKLKNKTKDTSYANQVTTPTPVKQTIRQKKEVQENGEMGYHAAARENANKPKHKSDAELLADMTPTIKEGSQLDYTQKALRRALQIEMEKKDE